MLQPEDKQRLERKSRGMRSQKIFHKENLQSNEALLTNRVDKKKCVQSSCSNNELKLLEEEMMELSRMLGQLRSRHQALESQQAELHQRLRSIKRSSHRKKHYQETCTKIRNLQACSTHHQQELSIAMASPVLQQLAHQATHPTNDDESHFSEFD